MKSARPSLLLLIILLAFQAIGAIGGGLALVIRPSGAILQMPISMLEHSPFPDFLIPGLFLLIVLGLFPAFVCFALIKKPRWQWAEMLNIFKDYHWAWSFAFYVGIILILWIDFEVMFLRSVDILHLIYSLLGVAIVFTTMLPPIRKLFRRD